MVSRRRIRRGWTGSWARVLRTALCFSAIAGLCGCTPVHFTVSSAPVRPEDAARYALANPELAVRLQVADFEIRNVDTQYRENEKDLFRRHFSVAIPNLIQEQLGKRQVFSEVTRVTSARPQSTDYIVTATYDFFERLGPRGGGWIPFAGNEAWIKGNLFVRVTEAKGGSTVLEKSYPEEHRDRTSVYIGAKVGYLQAAYIASIASEIINAIAEQRRVNP